MEITFKNKVIIITGGSRGIGKGLVEAFTKAGGKVYFTYRNNKDAANNLMKTSKGSAFGYQVNNCQVKEIEEFIQLVGKTEKKIDVLINNAGIVPIYLLPNTPPKIWNEVIATNLSATYYYSTAILQWLIRSKNGIIINISSIVADRPYKGVGAYSATKGAIESLSKVLALEFAPFNIRVNTIVPGLIKTETISAMTEKTKEKFLNRTPLKRFGKVEDIANAALFLASDKSSFITGTQLYVTGGRHLD